MMDRVCSTIRVYSVLILCSLFLALNGCKDDVVTAGSSLLDDNDKIIVCSDTFSLSSNLAPCGSIITAPDSFLLGEIATYIGEMNVPIKAVSAQAEDKTKTSTIKLVLEVRSRDQMDKVIKQLRKKSDIIDVYRTQG